MKYFEEVVELNSEQIKAKEILELCEAFTHNNNLGLPYFIDKLNTIWKRIILLRWKPELLYVYKLMHDIYGYFEKFGYWDKELWELFLAVVNNTKNNRIQAYLIKDYELFHRMNSNKENPFYGKLGELIEKFKNEIITKHKDWDYDVEEMRPLRYDEWIKYYSHLTYPQCKQIAAIRKKEVKEESEEEEPEGVSIIGGTLDPKKPHKEEKDEDIDKVKAKLKGKDKGKVKGKVKVKDKKKQKEEMKAKEKEKRKEKARRNKEKKIQKQKAREKARDKEENKEGDNDKVKDENKDKDKAKDQSTSKAKSENKDTEKAKGTEKSKGKDKKEDAEKGKDKKGK